MLINIRGQGITITPSRREHIEEGIKTTVQKYFPDAASTDVALVKEGHGVKAEINVKASRQSFVQGSGHSPDGLAAFDVALAHVGKQLRRYKRHLNNHHKNVEIELEFQPATQYVLSSSPEGDGDEAGDEPIIVAEMPTDIPKLTVSQAVMKMDLEALPVLMFVNRAHNGVNVVYRRPDGNLGWIDPKTK
ncbi:MAG: ribosome hibernation-promoting factor, HPF/YfiA family [Alphaproteobacteria bacterium]